MGILDDIEKIDDEETLRSTLKKIEKLEEENNKMLKEILRALRSRSKKNKNREGDER